MPFPFLPIAVAAFSAGLSKIGQDSANDRNSDEAQKNRDFQERMSNTQYQRAVADMQAAGLNPALAYQQGGAGNVSGSSAAAMQNANTGAAQATGLIPSSIIQQAQVANINAQTAKTQAEYWGQMIENKYQNENLSQRNTLQGGQIYQLEAAVKKANLEIELLSATQQNSIERSVQELRTAVANASTAEINSKTAELVRQLTDLDIPYAQAYADYYKGVGKYEPYAGAAGRFMDLLPGKFNLNLGSSKSVSGSTGYTPRQTRAIPGLMR